MMDGRTDAEGTRAGAQPPPIPSITLPVPLHCSHFWPSFLPEPLHAGHRFSPVPGVPGAASSPGSSSVLSGMAPPRDDGQNDQLKWCSKLHSTAAFSRLLRLSTECSLEGLSALPSLPRRAMCLSGRVDHFFSESVSSCACRFRSSWQRKTHRCVRARSTIAAAHWRPRERLEQSGETQEQSAAHANISPGCDFDAARRAERDRDGNDGRGRGLPIPHAGLSFACL